MIRITDADFKFVIRTLGALRLLCCVLVGLLFCTPLLAQTKPTEFDGAYERDALRVTLTEKAADGSTTQPSAATSRGAGGSVSSLRVVSALALVLALIFGLRWVGRRYFPAVTGGRTAGSVRVLSRSPVAPKQQVLLLQVGRRVLVVADNGTQLSPLSVITEPDEVAQIIGQHSSTATPGVFESAFGKAQDTFEETAPATAAPDDETEIGLATGSEPHQNEQESIASAQGDIKGLMDKVRGLAEQLGRST